MSLPHGAHQAPLHCGECNAPRQAQICPKCGSETFTPAEGWRYPQLPDVARIRQLAKQVGYAIGEHGTKERDLDLIAVPWTDDAVSPLELLQHIAIGLRARVIQTEQKPLGRLAASIQIDGYFKLIDLSVMPGHCV